MELSESKFLKHPDNQQIELIYNKISSLKQSIDDLEILFKQLAETHNKKEETNFIYMTIANIVTNYIDKDNRTAWKYIRFFQLGQNRKQ